MNCSEFLRSLDAWLDGELSEETQAEMQAHAVLCESCGAQWKAAGEIRQLLAHMDDEVQVPLPAQAGWRSAVRAEARLKRIRRISAAVSAAAAVCVLTVALMPMLSARQNNAMPEDMPQVAQVRMMDAAPAAYVEADGISESAKLDASAAPALGYAERRIVTDDVPAAYGYVQDIVAEYGCVVEREAEDTAGKRLYVLVPGESWEEFVSAVDHLGLNAEENGPVPTNAADMASLCVILAQG